MTLRPGHNLIRVAGALLAASLLVFVAPSIVWLALPVGVALGGLIVADYRDLRRRLPQMRLERRAPNIVGRDRLFEVQWTLRHEGDREFLGEWRDGLPRAAEPCFHSVPFRLDATEFEKSFTQKLRIPQRGEHSFGPMWLRLVGRFAMLEAQQTIESTATVRVLPETYHSPEELQKDTGHLLLMDKATRTRQHGVGTEFESLTEYRDGDDPRRIDWRTAARVGHLVVRRYQIERHRDVMLLIDCGRLMGADAGKGSKLDCAVDAALMVARVALQGADRCGLAMFDDQVLGYLSPVSGLSSLHSLAECVYAAQTRWRESDFARMFATLQQRHSKRSLVVVLSDMVDSETTQRFRASLARLAKRHVVLFAALQTPVLDTISRTLPEEPLDLARQAVAFQLLREREQALHAVRRCGVHVLDVAPSQLLVPLINQFIALRQESLI